MGIKNSMVGEYKNHLDALERNKQTRIDACIASDKELLDLFEVELKIPDFLVINHFLFMFGEVYSQSAREKVDVVKNIWDRMPYDKSNIALYLPLLSKYAQLKMKK